jgi:hypothetical protein
MSRRSTSKPLEVPLEALLHRGRVVLKPPDFKLSRKVPVARAVWRLSNSEGAISHVT